MHARTHSLTDTVPVINMCNIMHNVIYAVCYFTDNAKTLVPC